MKKVLIYINDSLGELDWIVPFIKSKEGRVFIFYIFLSGPGKNYHEKVDILKQYGLDENNIICINKHLKKDFYAFKFDQFLNRVLSRINMYSFWAIGISNSIFNFIWLAISHFLRYDSHKFDYIFRDYGLDNGLFLTHCLRFNNNAKIIIFPHGIALKKIHPSCLLEPPLKIVSADLWLENSDLSDIAKNNKVYKSIFLASGVPAFDTNYKKESLFDVESKKVLIITRPCRIFLGFNYADAYKVLDEILQQLESMGYLVEIKHHPRERELKGWRKIQNKYLNVKEIKQSLSDINGKYSACFTLYSTAPLFLLSRRIPVFEFSPYKNYTDYKKKFSVHYKGKRGLLTHDLLELKLFEKLDSSNISECMGKERLECLSAFQYRKCKDIFPGGANSSIANKLIELLDEKH
jgi:hypothetical protein